MTYRYKYPKKYRGHYSDIGRERALEHIREARELSIELGGTDEDVKNYFFSLPPAELTEIFYHYGKKCGTSAQEYAEKTFPYWKSGRRHMSGLVAGRLFNLLPPRMPWGVKYDLVENLWKQHCPRSDNVLLIGPDANHREIIETVHSHLLEVVQKYAISEPLQRRFKWLSEGDVNVEQQLLNHLLQKERELIVQAMQHRVPMLLKNLEEHGSVIHKMQQQIEIGKHKLALQFDAKTPGIKLMDRASYYTTSRISVPVGNGWWILIIIIIGFFLLLKYLR